MGFRSPENTCKEFKSGTGLTGYQQAVRDGFVGSEKEWIESIANDYVDSNLEDISETVAENFKQYFSQYMFHFLEETPISVFLSLGSEVLVSESEEGYPSVTILIEGN